MRRWESKLILLGIETAMYPHRYRHLVPFGPKG